MSCWEIAKKAEIGKLVLDRPVQDWLDGALRLPDVQLLDLSMPIVIESTRLPQGFHRDPIDQIIVATARVLKCPLFTRDRKILQYPNVVTIKV
jgi:PIN domain nuclease of toxin-antitoxin system